MFRAFLYLRLTSAKNRLRTQLLRLRQPKYLAGTAFVIAYFWFFFFRHVTSANTAAGIGELGLNPAESAPLVAGIAAVGLSLYLVALWIVPGDTPGIRFTQAEIAFLFPAPLNRAALIHYKVLSMQFSSLLQSCFFSLIFNHRNLFEGRAAQTILAWWALLTLVNLHRLGSSLTIARLSAKGLHHVRRRLLALAAVVAVMAMVALSIWKNLPAASAGTSSTAWLSALLTTGPLHWLLLPAQTMVAPSFAHGAIPFLKAYAPVLVVLAFHYLWVLRTDAAFEEASIAVAQRDANRLDQLRSTGTVQLGDQPRAARRAPFPIANTRWPELAFLWKNLLSTARPWLTAPVWLGCATALILLSVGLRYAMGNSYWMAGGAIAAMGVFVTGLALLYGPLLTRLDLRQDLVNADILKTYPLPGWRILLGEILAPVVVISAIIWFGLLAWFLGLHGHHPPTLSREWFSPPMRMMLVGCLAVLAPFVVALQLLVPNGAVILFPGMFRVARTPGAGVDLMGQRMLFGFGQFLALALVFLPAFGMGIASYFAMRGLFVIALALGVVSNSAPAPFTTELVATIVMIVVLTGEIWCGVWWLGGRFEKVDLSAETQP
jgi:ABC-2 type transport system permease protein